ncbi:hypothetical protein Ciccas_005180 [Cichlidogyrus casuarinus]|uniref:Uncharacterized protein n=1 Tax=Cichlidogyrus casuarinus TaxID=1844966 RepID=A0ABD2Q9C5_9PLAT
MEDNLVDKEALLVNKSLTGVSKLWKQPKKSVFLRYSIDPTNEEEWLRLHDLELFNLSFGRLEEYFYEHDSENVMFRNYVGRSLRDFFRENQDLKQIHRSHCSHPATIDCSVLEDQFKKLTSRFLLDTLRERLNNREFAEIVCSAHDLLLKQYLRGKVNISLSSLSRDLDFYGLLLEALEGVLKENLEKLPDYGPKELLIAIQTLALLLASLRNRLNWTLDCSADKYAERSTFRKSRLFEIMQENSTSPKSKTKPVATVETELCAAKEASLCLGHVAFFCSTFVDLMVDRIDSIDFRNLKLTQEKSLFFLTLPITSTLFNLLQCLDEYDCTEDPCLGLSWLHLVHDLISLGIPWQLKSAGQPTPVAQVNPLNQCCQSEPCRQLLRAVIDQCLHRNLLGFVFSQAVHCLCRLPPKISGAASAGFWSTVQSATSSSSVSSSANSQHTNPLTQNQEDANSSPEDDQSDSNSSGREFTTGISVTDPIARSLLIFHKRMTHLGDDIQDSSTVPSIWWSKNQPQEDKVFSLLSF